MSSSNLYYNKKYQWGVYFALFVALAFVPMIVGDDVFLLNQLSVFGVYAILALSLSLCWGFGGILNLGQGIAFGLGCYGMAMTMQLQSQDPIDDRIPPFMLNNSVEELPWLWELFWRTEIGILLALGVPTLFAVIFGFLMFKGRVSGPFFAIMSLALLSAIYMLVTDLQFLTNGSNGITPPDALEVFGIVIDPYDYASYWLVYAALVSLTIMCKLLTQSKFGLVVQALKNDPERVRFLGYSVALYETVIYAVSAFVAAVAGCCYVVLTQYCSNGQFGVVFSISIVIWAAIGGRGSLLWAMMGAFIVQGAQSYLGDEFLNAWLLILGFFFIIVVRFLPNGLASLWEMLLGSFSSGNSVSNADANES
jgi:urea transport system permease protein